MKSDNPISIAVIGAGLFGARHARVLAGIATCRLVAVVDINSDLADQLANELGVKACYTMEDLLKEQSLQAVVIALPDAMHKETTLAAIRSGCHVLLEKPMTTSLPEAEQIMEAIKGRDKIYMMGHLMRFDPRFIAVEQEIKKNKEDVLLVSIRKGLSEASAYHQKSGTNLIWHVAIHELDVLRFMTGLEITEVYAVSSQKKIVPEKLFDHVAVAGKLSNGSAFSLSVSWVLPEAVGSSIDSDWSIVTEKRAYTISTKQAGLSILTETGFHFPDVFRYQNKYGLHAGFIREMDEHFISCIWNQEKPLADFSDGYKSVLVCDSILKSLASGQAEKL